MEALKQITGIDRAVEEMRAAIEAERHAVEAELQPYINGVVTEDTLQAWKKDRASLNKRMKANESERTGIAAEWTSKLNPITGERKLITDLYKKAINNIDSQTKEFEAMRKKMRLEEVRKIWDETEKPGEIADWLTFDDVFNSKWLNSSTSDKSIREEIKTAFDSLLMSYSTIKGMNHDYEEEGLKELRRTHLLSDAVIKMNNLQQQAQIIEERRKAREEAERKAREEAERKAKEEAEEAERKAKEEAERREHEEYLKSLIKEVEPDTSDEEIQKFINGDEEDETLDDVFEDSILPDDEELPEDDDEELPEDEPCIRMTLEIHAGDKAKLIKILEDTGIYYNIL